MKSIILLTLLVAIVLSNPYKVLDLDSGAKIADVTHNFRKLALKYHPGRLIYPVEGLENVGIQERKSRFLALANAFNEIKVGYPIREQYSKDFQENYDEFYYRFFTNGTCGLNTEGEDVCENRSEFVPENAFQFSSAINLDMITIGEYFNRDVAFIVVCYKNKQHDDKLISTYSKISTKNKELFKVGGVNCKYENAICDAIFDSKDTDYSANIALPSNNAQFRSLTGYVTSVKNIAAMAMKEINDIEVDELYVQNYAQITAKANKDNKKVAIYFTEKHNSSKSMKLIANKVEPYFKFCSVSSVNKKMVEKFGITEYPQLVIMPDPTNINTAVSYEGEINKANIIDFLLKNKDPVESKFEELTQDLIESGKVCTSQDSHFCLIYNLNGDASLLEQHKDVPTQFKKSPIRFLYVNQGLKEQLDGQAGYVLIRSKRQRYTSAKASEKSLVDFINYSMEDSAHFNKVPENLLASIYSNEQKKDDL